MDYTLEIKRPSEWVIPELLAIFQRNQLHAIVTFNLQLARSGHVHCRCPHHGTDRCTCQYAVVLVYDPQYGQDEYRTITVHGRDGQVWLSFLRPAFTRLDEPTAEALETRILEMLWELAVSAQVETSPRSSRPESGISPLASP